ncbi:ABC transporter permease subunit, partial [Candidatus Sumerlaeota bacterium]|nr:ABC transporter permease subunit [Candidatus Sumerlaeota bacterium]
MVLVSPILNRELLTFLRTKRAFLGLLFFLLALTAATLICWWVVTSQRRLAMRTDLSRNLFLTITMAELFIFSAYAVILTCTKINSERDRKTLDLLVTAPLSRLHIILAKYASAVAVIVLMLFATAPFLSLCFLLGGLDWIEVVAVHAIILLAVLTYGMVGMACSALYRKNYVSLAAGFIVMLFLFIGLRGLGEYISRVVMNLDPSRVEAVAIATFLPSPMAAYLLASSLVPPVPLSRATFLGGHAAFQATVLIVSLLIAWRRFRWITESGGEAAPQPTRVIWREKKSQQAQSGGWALTAWLGWLLAAPVSMFIPRFRCFPRYIPTFCPVFWREARWLLSRRPGHRVLRCLVLIFVPVCIALLSRLGASSSDVWAFEDIMALGLVAAILAGFFTPILGARAVTGER